VNEVRKTNILTFLRISIKDLTKTLHIYKNLIKALCIYQNMDFSQSVSLSPKDGDFLKQALNRGELIFESTNDEFKNILHNITKWILPISYFEEYRERNNIANELLMKKKIEAVHIYNSFWTNDTFKFMISQVRENGGVIIGRQHGGGYGHHIVSPSERVEREISDFFITWGWTDKRLSPAIPLPDPRLSKFLNVHQEKNKNILFIGSHGQMYMFDYQSYFMPEFVHQQYYLLKKRFFKKLKEPIQKSILYRPYLYEYGWEERSRIKEILPDVCFDESTEAVENMKTCSLVVIDHPSTSFLEALVINVPTILFWDNEQAPMREEAKLYFQLLTDVGILHYNPESAAQKVNKIWDDIHGWWQQPEVQKAKDEFCWQFARTSKNRHKAWRVFLRTLK
jgi:putative transferase (TIGR04331 family)